MPGKWLYRTFLQPSKGQVTAEVYVQADTKEEAVDTVEHAVQGGGWELIDHRTNAIEYTPPAPTLGKGKYLYRMVITIRQRGRPIQSTAGL